jgi:hypothetical protein
MEEDAPSGAQDTDVSRADGSDFQDESLEERLDDVASNPWHSPAAASNSVHSGSQPSLFSPRLDDGVLFITLPLSSREALLLQHFFEHVGRPM